MNKATNIALANVTSLLADCGKPHDDSMEKDCCESCKNGLPCESCKEDQEVTAKRDMTLEEWLDTQAALYQIEGLPRGVRYVDAIDEQREDMKKRADDALSAALVAVEDAVAVVEAKSDLSLWKAAEADESLGDAYRALHSLKADMDAFEEVPNSMMPFYKAVMKAANAVASARKDAYQVRMLAKRLGR